MDPIREKANIMFTGIIEETGKLEGARDQGAGRILRVAAGVVVSDASIGDSIAVNGVCLTVTEFDDKGFSAFASSETLKLTTMGQWRPGLKLNLERATRPDTRMGGHMVQGHVDARGIIRAREQIGDSVDFQVEFPEAIRLLLAPKGSVCVDGISLTVNAVDDSRNIFQLRLIPETLRVTNAGLWQPGVALNLETDILGRYILRFLELRQSTGGLSTGGAGSGLKMEDLYQAGMDD